MTPILAGILLPQSVLHSQWFIVFAAFVGVNTIIYMGLTFSKLIPWPAPIHPRAIRKALGIGEAEGAARSAVAVVSRETAAETGVHDIARGFAWTGSIMVLWSALLTFLPGRNLVDYAGIAAGMVLLALAQIVARTKISARSASWIWSVSLSALAIGTLYAASQGHIERIGYVLVLAVVLGAVALTWPSFIVASVMLAGSFAVFTFEFTSVFDPRWIAPFSAALVAGALLMVIRRRSLRILGEVDRLENQLGSTDVLTGVLTRQGVLTLTPQVRRGAQRDNQPMFLMIVDIDELDRANRDYGSGYGDDLLRATADAIKSSARDADLLGRWSGDEFVLIGVGAEQSIEALSARIIRNVEASPVAVGKYPLRVSIGTAVGLPQDSLDSFIDTAMSELTGAAPAVPEAG